LAQLGSDFASGSLQPITVGSARPSHFGAEERVKRQVPRATATALPGQDENDTERQSPRARRRQPTEVALRSAAGDQRRGPFVQRGDAEPLELPKLVPATSNGEEVVSLHPQVIRTQPDPGSESRNPLQGCPPHTQRAESTRLTHASDPTVDSRT